MPVWLQLVCAGSAGLAAGLMGIALVPFLERFRFSEPPKREPSENGEESAPPQERARPTMCGLLLVFGMIFGMVLGFTLFRHFLRPDIPEKQYFAETASLRRMLVHGLILGTAGAVLDVFTVRRRLRYKLRRVWLMGAVLLVTLGILCIQGTPDLTILLQTAFLTVSWGLAQGLETETDGMTVTAGAVQCLFLTMLLLLGGQYLPVLYSLTAAGACLGCMVWNLHPAKCRLGRTGRFLLGSMVPMLCVQYGGWKIPLLITMVSLANALPYLFKKRTLLRLMEEGGIRPQTRLAMLAGFAAVCGAAAVLAVR